MTAVTRALRGRLLTFRDDPATAGEDAYSYIEDGLILLSGGRIAEMGEAAELLARLPEGTAVDHFPGGLILPGFIDAHIHFPQTQVIASYGAQLMDWLERYAFAEELRFAEPAHAAAVAGFFLDELARNGTTTAAVYGTVHPQAAEAFFTESHRRNTRMIAGKVLMDRGAPAALCDTAESAYADSKTLIQRWHGKGRQLYAVTPRFAITSTEAQLEAAGALLQEHPDCYLQTHLSENRREIETVHELFPWAESYTQVYERFGLLGARSLFGHCIHLSDQERRLLSESRSVAVFCPTSNLFIGSGLFDMAKAHDPILHLRVGLASDVGGGTSYSMLQTLAEGYKVLQLQHLVALGQGLQHGVAGAAADVAGQADAQMQDRVMRLGHVEEPRTDEEVGRGAEDGHRAALAEQPPLLVAEVDAVAEERARAQQAETLVDLGVALGPGEELVHRLDLAAVLAQVGLQVAVRVLLQQRARRLELRLGRGDGEARRHRIELPPLAMPALDEGLGVGVGALCGVAERGRRAPVHQHLAGDHARVAAVGLGEEGLRRLRVHRAVDRRRGGAVARQLVQEEAGHRGGVRRLGEAQLLGEGVALQPVHELRAVGSDDLGLGKMDMGVDEARQDEAAGKVVDRRAFGQARQQFGGLPHLGDTPAAQQDEAVFDVAVSVFASSCRVVAEGQEAPAQGACHGGHGGKSTKPGRRQRARRRGSGARRPR